MLVPFTVAPAREETLGEVGEEGDNTSRLYVLYVYICTSIILYRFAGSAGSAETSRYSNTFP